MQSLKIEYAPTKNLTARDQNMFSRQTLTDNVSLAKTDRFRFKDGSNPMISFDSKFFKATLSKKHFG